MTIPHLIAGFENSLLGTTPGKVFITEDYINAIVDQVNTPLVPANVPEAADDPGTTGEIRADADYIYVCVDTDTWVRAELNTWS